MFLCFFQYAKCKKCKNRTIKCILHIDERLEVIYNEDIQI